jgi:hypothetical protein
MLTARDLGKAFARNLRIVAAQSEGLTHQDSLRQTPHVNCLNWVLGHIAEGRDQVLALLGEPAVLGEEGAGYRRESDPVTGEGPGVVPLERLLAVLKEGQERIAAALAGLSEEALAEERRDGERVLPLGTLLHFAYFHDTYHAGQTELLRALAGKTDKVI